MTITYECIYCLSVHRIFLAGQVSFKCPSKSFAILRNLARILYLYHVMFIIKESSNYHGGVCVVDITSFSNKIIDKDEQEVASGKQGVRAACPKDKLQFNFPRALLILVPFLSLL